jgi:tungstate transport system substrate-binding protein
LRKRNLLVSMVVLVLAMLVAFAGCGQNQAQQPQNTPEPQVKDVILATTTSTQDSGLLDGVVKEMGVGVTTSAAVKFSPAI